MMAALTSFPSPSRRKYSDSDREQNLAFSSSFCLSFGGGDSIFKVHRERVPSIGSQRERHFIDPLTNQLGKFFDLYEGILKISFESLSTNQLGNFFGFERKNFLEFFYESPY